MAKRTADVVKEWEEKIIPRRQRIYIATVAVTYLILSAVVLYFYFFNSEETLGGTAVWKLVGGLWLVYFGLSFKITRFDEVGMIVSFGSAVWQIGSGLAFAPPFISRIERFPKGQIKLEIGTPITNKAGEVVHVTVEEGTPVLTDETPMRITSASATTARYSLTGEDGEKEKAIYEGDVYNDRLTFDPHVVVLLRIVNLYVFMEEIGSLPAVREFLRDASSSALQEIAGQMTPAQMVRNIALVNEFLTMKVEIRAGEYEVDTEHHKFGLLFKNESYKPNGTGSTEARYPYTGLDILNVQMTSTGNPKRVNEAQAENRKSAFEAQNIAIKGEGEGKALASRGRGRATAHQALLEAKAKGQKALQQVMKDGGDTALITAALDTLERSIKDTDKVIVNGGIGGMAAEAIRIIETIRQTQKST